MDNLQLSWLLQETAALMEIKGENPYKIRAYQNGARTVAELSSSVRTLINNGELAKVPGIGKGLRGQIEAYLQEGCLPELEKLRTDIPAGVASLLDVPGIGPKMARQFYQELGVTSVAELEQAAQARKIRQLRGLGGKTEMSILRGIERMKQRQGRTSLAIARPLAENISSVLQSAPGVRRVVVAGSFRRCRDTVKDLDFLVAADNGERVIDVFAEMPLVQEVAGKGTKKASAVLKAGLNADLRILPEEKFAFGLHYFTGSKDHNVHMRQIAERQGLSLSEYGLTVSSTGEELGAASEEDLFEHLGLAYIPAELREDRGEIEAAAENALPELITLDDIQGDLHMHTSYSDGTNSIEEMAAAAKKRGLRYIAICDHSKSLAVANGMSAELLRKQAAAVRSVSDKLGFPILAGVECDILSDGSLDYDDALLGDLEVVVASIHSGFQQDEHQITRRIIAAIKHPLTHIVAHPTGRMLGQREAYPVDMDAVIDAAAHYGKMLEINGTPERLDLHETYAAMCRERDVPLVINTDAHSVEQLDFMEGAVCYARRAWLEPKHVANTWSLADFLAYFKTTDRSYR